MHAGPPPPLATQGKLGISSNPTPGYQANGGAPTLTAALQGDLQGQARPCGGTLTAKGPSASEALYGAAPTAGKPVQGMWRLQPLLC